MSKAKKHKYKVHDHEKIDEVKRMRKAGGLEYIGNLILAGREERTVCFYDGSELEKYFRDGSVEQRWCHKCGIIYQFPTEKEEY